MRIILRKDSEAVASTVATLFTLLAVVLFLQAAIVAVVPAKQYGAERTTSIAAISAFDMLRSTASGAVFPGGQVTVTVPIGTAAVSPFAAPSPGDLRFNMGDSTRANISVSYVPTIHDSRVSKVDQDIILAIDSSGSMNQNDPNRLRISGAKEYVGRLSRPDRVASVDFDSVARLTRANVGGPAHHLYNTYNNGLPDYSGAQADLDTIDAAGSTYFAAPTPESIRWIYFEISMHYRGTVSCGTVAAASSVSGSLSLSLASRQYPAQTLRLEAGGVTVAQPVGIVVQQGMPVSYAPRAYGAGSLQVTLLTFTGPAFEATGTDYQFVTARFLSQSLDNQVIIRTDLQQQASDSGNISDYVKYWGTQGAATPAGVKAVTDPILAAKARMNWAQVNLTSSKLTPAKFDVDSAQNQLSASIVAAEDQVTRGQMQRWLATSAEDLVCRVACQLSQWQDWYTGVKLTIQSPTAAAWAIWFDQIFRKTGALTSSGVSGNTAVLSVNAVDLFAIDERVVELSFA